MNFVPQPDPHKEAIARLSAQIDHYLATGKRVEAVPPGASGQGPIFRNKKKKASPTNAPTD